MPAAADATYRTASDATSQAVPDVVPGVRRRLRSRELVAIGGRSRFARAVGVVGLCLLAFAFVPFVLIATDAAAHHRIFLGVDSWDPMDGLQYLAWVRDAQHGLIRNLFGSAGDGAVFLHPMWSPSGWIQAAAGVSDAAIMAFWTAVGGIVLFAGCVRLAMRQLPAERPVARLTAICLALFGGLTPLSMVLPAIDPTAGSDRQLIGGDLIPAASLWGYAPIAIAVGLMPFAVAGAERLIDGCRDRRTIAGTAVTALMIGWLHPWQGEALVVAAAILVAWRCHDDRVRHRIATSGRPARSSRPAARRYGGPLLVAAAAAVPLIYYLALSRIDAGWAVAERADQAATIPGPVLALGVLPLVVLALISARRSAGDVAARGLLAWPLATLLIVATTPTGQDRALCGLGVPVAVLVVRAWPTVGRSLRRVLLAAAGVVAALVPTAVYALDSVGRLHNPYMTTAAELNRSDARAARLAARSSQGRPILAPATLGTAIPALTDAPTWVGHAIWTPDYGRRAQLSSDFFAGTMRRRDARAFVRRTTARAIVQPCGDNRRLEQALRPLGFRRVPVGCATVYLARERS
jgi:hypothetical protein